MAAIPDDLCSRAVRPPHVPADIYCRFIADRTGRTTNQLRHSDNIRLHCHRTFSVRPPPRRLPAAYCQPVYGALSLAERTSRPPDGAFYGERFPRSNVDHTLKWSHYRRSVTLDKIRDSDVRRSPSVPFGYGQLTIKRTVNIWRVTSVRTTTTVQ